MTARYGHQPSAARRQEPLRSRAGGDSSLQSPHARSDEWTYPCFSAACRSIHVGRTRVVSHDQGRPARGGSCWDPVPGGIGGRPAGGRRRHRERHDAARVARPRLRARCAHQGAGIHCDVVVGALRAVTCPRADAAFYRRVGWQIVDVPITCAQPGGPVTLSNEVLAVLPLPGRHALAQRAYRRVRCALVTSAWAPTAIAGHHCGKSNYIAALHGHHTSVALTRH
jgi:hypothetical protein